MTRIDLPGGDRLILHGLSAPEAERGTVARLHSSGRRRWIAHPPKGEGQDAFVALRVEDGVAIADSFQGMSFRIDLDTGAIRPSAFVK
ncbi:hypothetical protein [Brevundimonas sp. NIBR11]|uniref:hypothetical protein n=1 Tax=Brevundimonas sp. NIBR11 TaxID=3015999 RepID=UPI0022F08CFA|nr:hypothetical protein [Brevundimonas sp. NIBR11]WGM30538.1 hypothetical protein KKHFBJBL_00763 [Brevundimonas sp. NIBR11]